ncbi:MAG: GntR family transcriptional regulator [Abditibacteriota bacterium]|nr:GntR family transcriptional regulator [Abditibacteriota bacterium]
MFKYIEIKSVLKKLIDDHEAHYKLPSRNEIIKQYGVSDITVRKALEELLREGLIYSHHGKGSFVAPKKKEFLEVYNVMQGTDVKRRMDRSGWYFPLVEELEAALEKYEMEMTISFYKRNEDLERQILERLLQKNSYGIIFYYSGYESNIPYYKKVIEINPNVVFVDRCIEGINANYVGTDNISSSKALAMEVCKEKLDKVYVIDIEGWGKTNVSFERQKGFAEILKKKNQKYEVLSSERSYYDDLPKIREYVKNDLCKYERVGFLCINSFMFKDVYEVCKEELNEKKKVMIGCYERPDIILENNMTLAWGRQNISKIAEITVELIKANSKEYKKIYVPAEIIKENFS